MISFEKFARDYVVDAIAAGLRDHAISRESADFPAPDTCGPMAPIFFDGRWHILNVMTARIDQPGLFRLPIGEDGSEVIVDLREVFA